MAVPRPTRGYWAKLEFGKNVDKPSLQDPPAGAELEWSRDGSPPKRVLPLPQAPAPRRHRSQANTDRTAHHPLLTDIEQHYQETKFNDVGHMRPSKRLLPDLFVTKDLLPTALVVANELFCALEAAGHTVMLAPKDQRYDRASLDYRDKPGRDLMEYYKWSPARPTLTFVGTVAIGLTLFELSEEAEVRYVNDKYVRVDATPSRRRSSDWIHTRDMPTGRLAIQAYSVAR